MKTIGSAAADTIETLMKTSKSHSIMDIMANGGVLISSRAGHKELCRLMPAAASPVDRTAPTRHHD
jgi:hypothetical protein